ncbi:MAG: DUF2798 domain-containing protein [Clostridia bacterium]|nr:DUF2798 domain-containing protein [Clostridia bacterium]
MRLNKLTQFILFNALASLGISMSISFFMTLINQGMDRYFLSAWGQSFIMGYIIAVPSSMLFVPLVEKVMNLMTAKEQI